MALINSLLNPMQQLFERFRTLPQVTIAKLAGLPGAATVSLSWPWTCALPLLVGRSVGAVVNVK